MMMMMMLFVGIDVESLLMMMGDVDVVDKKYADDGGCWFCCCCCCCCSWWRWQLQWCCLWWLWLWDVHVCLPRQKIQLTSVNIACSTSLIQLSGTLRWPCQPTGFKQEKKRITTTTAPSVKWLWELGRSPNSKSCDDLFVDTMLSEACCKEFGK